MDSSFNSYYYDEFGNKVENDEKETKTKMEIARETVANITKKLDGEDRFGMVLFDDSAYLAKPLNKVGKTDMEAIREEILKVETDGGTNMESGYKKGAELFKDIDIDSNEYENRIIFLTDAMPNTGNTNKNSLQEMAQNWAEKKVYTSFIGIGVDFNTEVINTITKTKGANYFSVHSTKEFKKRLDEEFDYLVTPLVFDLELNFE